MAVAFDPSNVTSKVDFGALVDLSQLHGLNILITGGANGIGIPLAASAAFSLMANMHNKELQLPGNFVGKGLFVECNSKH